MGNFLERVIGSMPTTNSNGDIIPSNIQRNLKSIGEKGGQKYSNIVDKIVDTILQK